MNIADHNIQAEVMSEKVFSRLSTFIYAECGIKMPPSKKTMLEGRLRKRLRMLGMDSFTDYCDYLFSPKGMPAECVPMIDVVTTNKTDFFREPNHFDYLSEAALPELMRLHGSKRKPRLNLWSSACSTGEEPFTLAMVLSEFAEGYPELHFSILATDISTRVLEKAKRGIYEHDRVEPIPVALRKKYLLRGKDQNKGIVRIVPDVMAHVVFKRLNLMEENYRVSKPMDVIFCRNVLIYFDRETQEKILNQLCRHLIPGGYLFVGHSETLHGLDVPRVHVAKGGSSVYRKH